VFQSIFVTFIFSALFHEMFFIVAFRQVTFYLTALQIVQLPLFFVLGKLKGTIYGNIIYWYGQFFGITMVAYLYQRDYFNYTYFRGGKFTY
jgi:hypothetical protein